VGGATLFPFIYKNQVSKNTLLYVTKLINNCMTTHYEKYKETIKKVARRNHKKRVIAYHCKSFVNF